MLENNHLIKNIEMVARQPPSVKLYIIIVSSQTISVTHHTATSAPIHLSLWKSEIQQPGGNYKQKMTCAELAFANINTFKFVIGMSMYLPL